MNKNDTARMRERLLASTIATILGAGSAAKAQEPAPSAGPVEEVTVTGSRIVRRDFTANSPIMTVDQELFDETMSIGVDHILNQLPQFVPAVTQFTTTETQSTATVTPGASTVSLRGLGANRNLVLIDGRRAMPVNASGAVDTNMIPSAAIARVETITGGASSVYGADAMAGVVNFILKRDFEGVDIDMRYGETQEGDGEEFRLAGVFGANFAEGSGNVLLGFEHASRGKAYETTRRFYRRGYANPTANGTATRLSDNYYAVDTTNPPDAAVVADVFGVAPGEVGTGGNFYLNADGTLYRSSADGNFRYNGPFIVDGLVYRKILENNPNTNALNGQLVENLLEGRMVSLPLDRYSAFGRAHLDIADNVSAFMQANFAQSETETLLIYSPALGSWGVKIPYGNEIYAPSVDENGNTLGAYLPGGTYGLNCPPVGGCTESQAFPVTPELAALLDSRPDPNADWDLGHVLTYAGPRRSENRTTSYQIVAGLEGGFPNNDWTWEAYVSHGATEVATTLLGYGSVGRYRFLVTQPNYGRGTFYVGNPEGDGFGAGTAQCTTGLPIMEQFTPSEDCIRSITVDLQNNGQMTQDVVEFNLQGRLLDVPAGEARFAVGASYRKNEYFYRPDAHMSQENFFDHVMGVFPGSKSEGDISARDVYGELLLPVLRDKPGVRELNLELGYRYSDNDPTGSVDTYKGLIDWSITDRIRLRGGRQVANRAPNIAELYLSRTQTLGASAIGDLCAETNPVSPLSANPALNPNAARVRAICEYHMGPTGAAAFYDPDFDQPTGLGFVFANTTGNPNLEHETAKTITFGAVMQLTDSLSLTVDWYDIRIDDMIAAQSVDAVYRNCFDPAVNPTFDPTTPACSLLVRDPVTGLRQATDVTYSNDSAIDTQGVDLQLNWGTPIGAGNLNLSLLASYLISMKTRLDPEQDWIEWEGSSGPQGLTGVQGGSYEYRTFTTLSYFRDRWNLALRWRHLPDRLPADRVTNPTSTTLSPGSYDIFDLSGGWRFPNEWSLRFGIDNLFDKQPLVTNANQFQSGSSTDAGFYDVLGRRGYIGFSMSF